MRLLVVVQVLLVPVIAFAQSNCEVLMQDRGAYRIRIDGNPTDLVGRRLYEQALGERQSLREQLAETEAKLTELGDLARQYEDLRQKHIALTLEYQQLAQDSITLNTKFRDTSNQLVDLNARYSETVQDYDDLAGKYRSLALNSRSPRFDIGVGVNNSDREQNWDLLFGAGIYRFKGWVYGNADRQGIAVGASF